MKNREKRVLKTMCFFDIDFSSLFVDFLQFWLDFGRPRRLKKSIKNRKNRVRDGFGACLGSSIDFGHDFGAIWMDFGRILDGHFACSVAQDRELAALGVTYQKYWGDEEQINRESRPNTLKDQGDSRKAPRPAAFT